MDETALHDLAADRRIAGRPVEQVLRRSRRLYRRRRSVQAVGATVAAAGLVGVGTLATRDEAAPVRTAAPPPPLCPGIVPDTDPSTFEPSPEIALADVQADLRLFPTVLPDGAEVTAVNAYRDAGRWCGGDPVLSLHADGGDDMVESTVMLLGPYKSPVDPHMYGDDTAVEPTQLRGRDASRFVLAGDDVIGIAWTDEIGASWLIEGNSVPEATLRDIAEGLQLDAGAVPVAHLPAAARPAGWEQAWQADQLPPAREERPGAIWWYVEMGPAENGCFFRGRTGRAGEPPVSALVAPGVRIVEVRGQEAIQFDDTWLMWREPSGAVIELICEPGIDNLTEVADSLVPVEPDDPRLPGG